MQRLESGKRRSEMTGAFFELAYYSHYHVFIGKFLKNDLRDDKGVLLLKDRNLTFRGKKVIELGVLQNISNAHGAMLMGYKDECVFLKKKSQYLKTLKDSISTREGKELFSMAS